MQVVSYVLKGKIKASLYTKQGENYTKKVKILTDNSLSFIEQDEHLLNNLHEFEATVPTFFIDILFPDYDMDRPGIYYEQIK